MFFEALLISASIFASDYKSVLTGHCYLHDGVSPVVTVGGKDWYISVFENNNDTDFLVGYNANMYEVFVKTSVMKNRKFANLIFMNNGLADLTLEGLRLSSNSKLDVVFSKPPN